ncbi:MAG: Tad domain-containing protein [Halobacteriovoraceae bacterium]|nr:Tad domain-containing protein [Halobacteriovoraceae bacterium]
MSSELEPKKPLFIKEKKWKEAGQLSIFLGMTTLVVTTFIAFVVNVGLFVKAKINLQNAVDASAYAGAAVQARQLSNMGYLNWELRNTYKEWMLKYYVFGNIGLDAIENETKIQSGSEPTGSCTSNTGPPGAPYALNPGSGMNFRLRQFRGSDCRYYNGDVYDRFNVPSVCIHFGSNNNICELVTQPGLPRFNTVGLPSISEQHESLLNSIVSTKAADCSNRTNINMGSAILWTYGTGNKDIFPGIPEIASERVGAWVQALELGLRMRNLERIVNQPPQGAICRSGDGCVSIQDINGDNNPLPFLERTSKAFWSGYRNLSGGAKKSTDSADFANSFKMREIPPNVVDIDEQSLSGLLINAGAGNFQKYYLDLKVMAINYAIFYTSFYPYSDAFRNDSGIPAEATCGGTKTALPVPGYILGFVKNPLVPTYYAVEGEANFVGLFFPFAKRDGITLRTYAAAKPFGGRIGPALFDVGPSDIGRQNVESRDDKEVSANYISMLDASALPQSSSADFAETIVKGGYPVPTDSSFWVSATGAATVGGIPSVSRDTGYGVPNLLYDFDSYSEIESLGFGASAVNRLANALNDTVAYRNTPVENQYGLYNKDQFLKFARNKQGGGGAIFSNQQVLQSIYRVRKPTRYEALNYMVPLMDETGDNALRIDSNPYVQLLPQTLPEDPTTRLYRLFAPLYGEGTMFATPAAVSNSVNNYINANSDSIKKYLDTIKAIADGMRAFATRGGDSYVTAANDLYPQDGNLDNTSPDFCANLPLAAKIHKFLSTSEGGCGIAPIGRKVQEYFSAPPTSNPQFPYFYVSTIRQPDFDARQVLTGYRPGRRQGAEPDGSIGSPFSSEKLLAKRNSYSVKFIPIKKVLGGEEPYDKNVFLDLSSDTSNYGGVTTDFSFSSPMLNAIDSEELRDYRGILSF